MSEVKRSGVILSTVGVILLRGNIQGSEWSSKGNDLIRAAKKIALLMPPKMSKHVKYDECERVTHRSQFMGQTLFTSNP